jgi:nicotinamidase-related amidase
MGMPDELQGPRGNQRSPVALLLVDTINHMEFPGSERLVRHARPMAERIARLKARAVRARIPIIYVNDNFGRWRSDFRHLVHYCTTADVPGREVSRMLRPGPDDYFVLKPKHSGFFGTTLDVLLEALGVRTVILTGVAGNICVLFTANDAYMRDLGLYVPADCIASNTARENDYALGQMHTVMKAVITPSPRLALSRLASRARPRPPRRAAR